MRGDFTRDSFNPAKAYTRVLMQQGRVQLDADWNEQSSILWRHLQGTMRDLLGSHAGPGDNCGFAIVPASDIASTTASKDEQTKLRAMLKDPGDFLIGPGVYYVDGIRAANEDFVRFSHQSDLQRTKPLNSTNHPYHLIYLDVWENSFSALQDPSIREVALNGADTSARAALVWQVRAYEWDDGVTDADFDVVNNNWASLTDHWQPENRGSLQVRTVSAVESDSLEASIISPQSAYRGPQNQLYRVEVHHSGTAKQGATFKWSRENASVNFAIENFADPTVTLSGLGRDARSTLSAGDWVEISDDDTIFRHVVHPLRRVESVDRQRNIVTLQAIAGEGMTTHKDRHPVLTRWDHKQGDPRRGGLELKDGAALIREGGNNWLKLENGIQVLFESDPAQTYRSGDYWLIPARTATGSIEWPQDSTGPLAQGPHGIEHHYAPLAIVKFDGNAIALWRPFRRKFSNSTEIA
jgi:hypothetical protein